jgi:hypothetical protein
MTQKLGRHCTVCSHDQHREIDAAILRHATGYLKIARHYGLVLASVQRHAAKHLAEQLRDVEEVRMLLDRESLTRELIALHAATRRVLDRAEGAGENRVVLAAIDVAGRNIERLAHFLPPVSAAALVAAEDADRITRMQASDRAAMARLRGLTQARTKECDDLFRHEGDEHAAR